jgi:hypothetical protein
MEFFLEQVFDAGSDDSSPATIKEFDNNDDFDRLRLLPWLH